MSFELSFAVSFVTAGLVSFFVASVCETPLSILIRRIIRSETSRAFTKYVRYATYLVGISHGVRLDPLGFELRAHIFTQLKQDFIHRVSDHLEWWVWLLGILTIIMQSLTAIAAMYLALFSFGLIVYTTVKAREK